MQHNVSHKLHRGNRMKAHQRIPIYNNEINNNDNNNFNNGMPKLGPIREFISTRNGIGKQVLSSSKPRV